MERFIKTDFFELVSRSLHASGNISLKLMETAYRDFSLMLMHSTRQGVDLGQLHYSLGFTITELEGLRLAGEVKKKCCRGLLL